MQITLPPKQEEWLRSQVAAGHFESIDEALAVAVAELMAIENDDLAWAKAEVEEARAAAAAGEVISGDEFLAEVRRKIGSPRSS
jgi:Arc/MetJ-type ribon-helix-helix transcriptional regulator